jgi:hypothetical protein
MVFVFATLRRLSSSPLLLLLREGAKSVCVRACERGFVRSSAVEDLASAGILFFLFSVSQDGRGVDQ